jgi:hypothetical protein
LDEREERRWGRGEWGEEDGQEEELTENYTKSTS